MFSQAKIRIKESARRARVIGGSGAAGQQQQQASRHEDQENQMENNANNHRMSNGKGPSTGNASAAYRPSMMSFQRERARDRMEMFYDDQYGDMMDLGDMDDYPLDAANGGMMMGHGMDMDDMMGMMATGGPGHMMFGGRGGRGRDHEKHVDKVVHTDFFNKFEDLMDPEDLD